MTKYPIFLEMQGRKAVVIGGGSVSLQKARVLFDSGARVVIVAEKPGDLLIDFCNKNHIELIRSKYLKEYLNEATLVIAATNKEDVNKMVYQDSQKLGILCNVVDCPQICDFFVPAVLRRNDLQIAIGTEGNCPAYAGHLRKKLEEIITEESGDFLNELEQIRRKILTEIKDATERKVLLGNLVDDESFKYYIKNGPDIWRTRAADIIEKTKA